MWISTGPSCFKKIEGFSAGFSEYPGSTGVAVPRPYANNPAVHPLYCMAHCELMPTQCIGFDLRIVPGAGPVCYFAALRTIEGASFDLYIRRC